MRPNSVIDVLVAFKTLLSVYIAGQCGLPDGSNRLLILNVVASRPLKRANPDRDMLLFFATVSIAPHTAACVGIFFSWCLNLCIRLDSNHN